MIRPVNLEEWHPDTDINRELFRRSPPIIRWAEKNEGPINDSEKGMEEGTEHWRNVRHTGNLRLSSWNYELVLKLDSSVVVDVNDLGVKPRGIRLDIL